MKKLTFALALLALPLAARTEPPPAAASAEKSPADVAEAALRAIMQATPPAGVERPSRAYYLFQDRNFREFAAAARDFGTKFPTDPRRYEGWVQSSYTRPWFIVDFKPEFDTAPGEKNMIVDQPALMAFWAT